MVWGIFKERALHWEWLRLGGGGHSLMPTLLSKIPVNREIYREFPHFSGASVEDAPRKTAPVAAYKASAPNS